MEKEFDRFAKEYRDIHTESIRGLSGTDSYYFSEYKVIELKKYEQDKPAVVLDLGCGDGVTEFFFTKYFPAFKITGLDVSHESIEVAKSKQLVNTKFEVFNGDAIPYPDCSFDIVFLAGVLHHINRQDQLNIIEEIYRVLKPGGRVYIFEHNPINPFTRYLVRMCEFDNGVTLLNPARCKKLIQQAGFSRSSKRFTLFFPRQRFFEWLLKLEDYLSWVPLGAQYYFFARKD